MIFSCEWCGFEVVDYREYIQHREMHQDLNIFGGLTKDHGKRYDVTKCSICGSIFKTSMTNHHKQLHGNIDHQQKEAVMFEQRNFQHTLHRFRCKHCGKFYRTKFNLNRHVQSAHMGLSFPCSQCNKVFTRLSHRDQHQRNCQGDEFICGTCGKKCSSAGGLKLHAITHETPYIRIYQHNDSIDPPTHETTANRQMNHQNDSLHAPAITHETPSNVSQQIESHSTATHSSNVRTRTFRCHKCNSSFPNRRQLYLHERQEHNQVGEGLRSHPWGQNSAPWERQDGSIDEELKTVYNANSSLILAQHDLGPVRSIYNFPIDNTVNLNRLIRFAGEIYDREHRSFRLNMSFGMILQNRRTGEYRYYIPYVNSNVFESPVFISKRSDLRRLYLQLRKWDILTELLRNRPNTEWIPVLMTNVHFTITSTNYVLGRGCLPNYILKKTSVIALDNHRGKPYNDNLCLFRCLALHRGYDPQSLETPSKDYYQQWKRKKERTEPFPGVRLSEIPEFESLFEANVEIFSLSEDEIVTPIYKSRGRYATSLYVNLYENHLSYIKDFKQYAKKFQCNLCQRHFCHYGTFKRHQKTCDNKTKYIYPGKFYRMPLTLFEKLEQFNIHVPEEDRVFPWFICYDFESMFETVDDNPTDSLEWVHKHVAISVSICSNVPDYQECKCIIEPDQDKLVKDMLQYMLTIAKKVEELAEEKWGRIIKAIKKKLKRDDFGSNAYLSTVSDEEDEEEEDEEEEEENVKEDGPRKQLKRLYGQVKGYLQQVPVIGFNSAKYDLNLIKQRIAKHLNLHQTEDKDGKFVVKKNNSYACISTAILKFLDISQFLSPGSSYASFLKAYGVEEGKGYFPYEWLDDVTKLDSTELPPHDAFYSKLKQKNISKEEYNFCQQIWCDNNMKTFKDFLEWYNNLDVGPFVVAVERLQKFYFDETIDLFKTAISVPGIARQLLFRSARAERVNFALFDRNNADLYQTVKQNLIGGASVIFCRHHKRNETKIRRNKLCSQIEGYDANALYLWAIDQDMPVGPYVRRFAHTGFKPELRDKYMSAIYWMEWIMYKEGITIFHEHNSGSEVRVGRYPVDGFRMNKTDKTREPVCYQFHGCYFHGHECEVTRHVTDKKWHDNKKSKFKKTQEITTYLKNKGCIVIEMWECKFREYCKKHPEIYQFINSRRPGFFSTHRGKVTENHILKAVRDNELFGMIEVDIEVPQNWTNSFTHSTMSPYEYFQEMSPLFCNTEIPFEAIGSHMQDHVLKHGLSKAPRRLLVGGMKAKQILLATPLLHWYINHGMAVTKIYQVVEFQQKRCFSKFVQKVSNARREGDRNLDTAIIADTMKIIGNSAYGSMIMDKHKHRDIIYVKGENETFLKVNEPRFRKLECLDMEEQYYEIEMAKRKIRLDLPIQLGFFILQYAKLRMLQFYYDFMDVYVDRSDFEYCEMDTDSAYMAISGSCLDDIIKPEMKEKYLKGLNCFCTDAIPVEADDKFHWFPRRCCAKHAKFDKRTPGLFKLEFEGDEILGLCSKTYIVRQTKVVKPSSTRLMAYKLLRKAKRLKPRQLTMKPRIKNEYKFSSKGVSKRHVKTPMCTFKRVLETGLSKSSTNRGFRARNNTIYTYTQNRRGFGYFYCKRVVGDDGCTTSPLDITLCPIPPDKEDDDDINDFNVLNIC